MRIYLARIPEFNAIMFPTGFAVVFSGLLLRMRNEAQLAGVIAHESAPLPAEAPASPMARHAAQDRHFLVPRDGGRASPAARPESMPATSSSWPSSGTILSLLQLQPHDEAEADAMGVRLLAEAGYDPMAMSETWEQLIGELDLSAKYRRKHRDRGLLAVRDPPVARSREWPTSRSRPPK